MTNDGVLAVAERLGVQTMPLVLSIGPQQDSYDEWTRAQQLAVTELTERGVLDSYGEVTDPDLAAAFFVLAQPERELVARVYGLTEPAWQARICLAGRGEQHALAIRRGDTFDVEAVWADGSGAALASALLSVLGSANPAEVANFSAPADELGERMDAAETSSEFADTLYALGVPGHEATTYGLAFASVHTYAEVVAYTHTDGVTTRPPGAVAVYDTGRGRIVAAPGIAPDQQVWSTVTPGTDHRIAQAISALIDALPGGRWLPQ